MAFNTDKLSYFHSFSKMPVQSGSNFADGTSLGNAINKSGHTVTASEVWASDIPYYGAMGSLDDIISKVQPYARKNDMCLVTTTGKTYIYDGVGNWSLINADDATNAGKLKAGQLIKNANDDVVLLYHKGETLTNLTAGNNANTNSADNAARLWTNLDVDGSSLGVNSLGENITRLVEQFVGPTDKAINGLASVSYSPSINNGTLVAGTDYYDYCFSGTILWANKKTAKTPIDCFEYVGAKVSTVVDTVATQGSTLQTVKDLVDEIADEIGKGNTGSGNTLGTRVADTESALRTLLEIEENGKIETSKSITDFITDSINSNETDSIGKAIEDAKNAAIAGSTVTLTADTTEGNTGITIDPNGDASNEFTIGIDQSIIATVASVTAITNIITDNKEEIDGKISTINGILEGLTSGDNSISAQIQAVTDRLSPNGDIGQAIASKVASVTLGTVPTGVSLGTDTKNPVLTIETAASTETAGNGTDAAKLVTGGVAKGLAQHYADLAVDTIDDRSLANTDSSTQGTYVTVTTSGTVGTGLTVNVNDAALASTVSAAASAIQTVNVNGAALSATDNAVDITAIVGVNEDYSNGIRLQKTTDNKVVVDVIPAEYSTETNEWNLTEEAASYFTTAGDVSTAIEDAIYTAKLQLAEEDSVKGLNIKTHTSGYDYLSISAATYTPSSESGEIGTWTDTTKNYLVTGATVAAAISDVNAKVDALHQTPQFKVEVVTGVTDLTKWEESVTDGIKENYIYLVENSEAADGSYIEYIAYKNGDTIVTERIGTTKTDLSGYVKTVTINGQSYTATANNAGTINIGKAASSMATGQATTLANQSSVYGHIADNGTLTLGVATANDSVMGVSKLFTGHASTINSANPENAIDVAVSLKTISGLYDRIASSLTSISASDETKLVGISVTGDSTIDTKLIDCSVNHSLIPNASYDNNINGILTYRDWRGTEQKKPIDCDLIVDGNNAFAESSLTTWIDDIPNLEKGYRMFYNSLSLSTYCGDLSSLTNGQEMFSSCTNLESFCGDLSSLTNGTSMFMSCKLDMESIEFIAETINDTPNTDSEIYIGYSVLSSEVDALKAALSSIKSKGWKVETQSGVYND